MAIVYEARVKKSHRFPQVLAFNRHEYLPGEWRDVPEGFEEEAENHPYLDVREKQEGKPEGLAALTIKELKALPEWDLIEDKPARKDDIIAAIEKVRAETEVEPEAEPEAEPESPLPFAKQPTLDEIRGVK